MGNYVTITTTTGNYYTEIRNVITAFMDTYNITFPKNADDVSNYETYILLTERNIRNLIKKDGVHELTFRIDDVSRGCIFIKEIQRETKIINARKVNMIEYKIMNIDFNIDTCFDRLKAYTKDVIEETNKEFRNSKLVINIID